jgi:hypothetical protein
LKKKKKETNAQISIKIIPQCGNKHTYDKVIPKLEEIGWYLCGDEQDHDESPANKVMKLRFP